MGLRYDYLDQPDFELVHQTLIESLYGLFSEPRKVLNQNNGLIDLVYSAEGQNWFAIPQHQTLYERRKGHISLIPTNRFKLSLTDLLPLTTKVTHITHQDYKDLILGERTEQTLSLNGCEGEMDHNHMSKGMVS